MVSEKHTVNTIQAKHIDEFSRCAAKCLRTRPTPGHESEIVTSFPAATNREDDFHLGVLLFELGECAETAVCAVNRHLGIGPFIA